MSWFANKTATAVISGCGKYRYLLTRRWGLGDRRIVFIMLNPSTADALRDDPTIRKCIAFSKLMNASELHVVNLFAYRATKPREILDKPWSVIVGPENDHYLEAALQSRPNTQVVCAWGAHGWWCDRDADVVDMARQAGVKLYCLGLTKGGHPAHPLYLPLNRETIPYE